MSEWWDWENGPRLPARDGIKARSASDLPAAYATFELEGDIIAHGAGQHVAGHLGGSVGVDDLAVG